MSEHLSMADQLKAFSTPPTDNVVRRRNSTGALEIQPGEVNLEPAESGTLIERITLAASNSLRRYVGLTADEMIPGPVPKVVTRRNPSLDNYFADLLLRSSYVPTDYLPVYEEHVMFGSPDDLPSESNQRLVGAILIGIGGRSHNPEFKKVYDEHSTHGTRTAPSASQIVFAEHLGAYSDRPRVQGVTKLLREINCVDSEGGATHGHLYNILKSLNVAEFVYPGFVFEPLYPQWKRAIIGACLSSVCVAMDDFAGLDLEEAVRDLGREWEIYLSKVEKRIKYGFPDKVIPAAITEIKRTLLRPKEPLIDGIPSYLSLKRILFALRRAGWERPEVAYLLEFLFDAMRQAQQSFEEILLRDLPVRTLSEGYHFVFYQMEPKDRLPHRGLLSRATKQAIKGILAVFDPVRETTAVFSTRDLPRSVWRNFVEEAVTAEGDAVWYVPTGADGSLAGFMLNGTESFRGVKKSVLGENGLIELFRNAIENTSQ